jgi:hypothetical protein
MSQVAIIGIETIESRRNMIGSFPIVFQNLETLMDDLAPLWWVNLKFKIADSLEIPAV